MGRHPRFNDQDPKHETTHKLCVTTCTSGDFNCLFVLTRANALFPIYSPVNEHK